ncbi:hypothetical protein P7K49_027633 [Saguinus oedipus]|uniref:Uncharacterized protein n=1 Tax=Saguinus oedipus TaxID=9490 RepID=A0ABQ9UAW9_SAGOE|nr:hypothetical protein P7K49_027633 [Saguinus oedipus]
MRPLEPPADESPDGSCTEHHGPPVQRVQVSLAFFQRGLLLLQAAAESFGLLLMLGRGWQGIGIREKSACSLGPYALRGPQPGLSAAASAPTSSRPCFLPVQETGPKDQLRNSQGSMQSKNADETVAGDKHHWKIVTAGLPMARETSPPISLLLNVKFWKRTYSV